MKRPIRSRRNVVIASAAGLTFLVTAALAGLGWRLLSQENAFEKQQRRDRVEQAADRWLASFIRVVSDFDRALARSDGTASALPLDTAPVDGAVLLRISEAGIQTHPTGQLLYYPAVPRPAPLSEQFEDADRLEFKAADIEANARLLTSLSKSGNPQTRAESLLRLGRVYMKRKDRARALAAYEQLASVDVASQAEVPYAVLARCARLRILAEQPALSGETAAEAGTLLADLETGRWPLRKESYTYYTAAVRQLATGAEARPSPERLAVSEAADLLWRDWQDHQRGEPVPRRRIYTSAQRTVFLSSHVSGDRLVALAVPWVSLVRHPELATTTADVTPTLVDPTAGPPAGPVPAADNVHAARTLSVAQLSGSVYFTLSDTATLDAVADSRRKYIVFGLIAVAVLVSLACYAMARGLLRELQATALQADFISSVSHEFRTPLTTLAQMTELLDDDRVQDEARRRRYVRFMRNETSRLHRLVENLLDFGRMEANARIYRADPVDFAEVVRETVREYGDEVTSSGYSFEVTGEPSRMLVEGDRDALHRVVRNLLENAVKYSPDSRTVWVESGRQNGHAVLKVRDQGIGIPAAEQRRIFERFVRGEAAKGACIQGSGIGLAMVKEIVDAHRGQITVESAIGTGSTFVVRVPLSTAHEERV